MEGGGEQFGPRVCARCGGKLFKEEAGFGEGEAWGGLEVAESLQCSGAGIPVVAGYFAECGCADSGGCDEGSPDEAPTSLEGARVVLWEGAAREEEGGGSEFSILELGKVGTEELEFGGAAGETTDFFGAQCKEEELGWDLGLGRWGSGGVGFFWVGRPAELEFELVFALEGPGFDAASAEVGSEFGCEAVCGEDTRGLDEFDVA